LFSRLVDWYSTAPFRDLRLLIWKHLVLSLVIPVMHIHAGIANHWITPLAIDSHFFLTLVDRFDLLLLFPVHPANI
jgi:hypothetical protein